uniref:DUF4283 domain-containing protein n=1 Tax=Salix viminalis TaxID=40686 RepID=A0A6N2N999_SALVM
MDGPKTICRETTDDSTEETDLLLRSNKKVKIGDTSGLSYVDKLMGETVETKTMDEDTELNDCISEDDDDDSDEEDCPVIKLTVEEKKRIRGPWKPTIIKLMGRKVGYMFFMQRLKNMWKLRGDFTLTDLGNDFYLAKFANTDDREHVLFGGPWMVTDHYLTVRTWHPNFDPVEATIDKVAVWVRLPDLALEYYDSSILWKIGNKIGKTLKVDRTTSVGTRGNFARICVEEICPHAPQGSQDETNVMETTGDPLVPIVRPEIMESFGSWMIADRRNRRPSKRMLPEEKKGNGKGGENAGNQGKNLRATTDSHLMISTRYNALMARDGDTEDFGAGEENPQENRAENAEKIPQDPRAEKSPNNKLGESSHQDTRAENSPHDTRAENSPHDTRAENSPHDTRAEMRNKDTRAEKRIVGTRAEKRPVVARTEKRAANGSNYNANSNQNQTMTRLSAKGKEKINSSREDSKFVTRREEKMQHGCRTEHEYYRRGTAQPQQKDTQGQVMEPPDKGALMERQTDLGEEGDSMMDTHNPEEEMMVEEGDALMEITR